MSYDYKSDVIGSVVRCHICGHAMTRGEGCQSCIERADAVVESMKTFEAKNAELARLRADLAAEQRGRVYSEARGLMRTGAAWAREYIATAYEQWNDLTVPGVVRSLAAEMDAAIERGEVEVPNER